jgi:hypothetical protein
MDYYIRRINIRVTSIMTTLVHTDSRNFQASTDKSLVSTKAFNEEFYTYTVSKNALGVTRGAFSFVTGATATNCPGRRVLHLTGRKLYPDVNPMDTFAGTFPSGGAAPLTAKKFLVAVYDPISFLTGFIDPTSNTFAKYDQNLPNFFDLGTSGSGVQWSGGGQGGELNLGDAGTSASLTGTDSFNAGYASVGQVVSDGSAIRVVSAIVKPTSKILLTPSVGNRAYVTGVGAAVDAPTNPAAPNARAYNGPTIPGSLQFTITPTGGGTTTFLIIN